MLSPKPPEEDGAGDEAADGKATDGIMAGAGA